MRTRRSQAPAASATSKTPPPSPAPTMDSVREALPELLGVVFEYLRPPSGLALMTCSRRWRDKSDRDVAFSNLVWRTWYESTFGPRDTPVGDGKMRIPPRRHVWRDCYEGSWRFRLEAGTRAMGLEIGRPITDYDPRRTRVPLGVRGGMERRNSRLLAHAGPDQNVSEFRYGPFPEDSEANVDLTSIARSDWKTRWRVADAKVSDGMYSFPLEGVLDVKDVGGDGSDLFYCWLSSEMHWYEGAENVDVDVQDVVSRYTPLDSRYREASADNITLASIRVYSRSGSNLMRYLYDPERPAVGRRRIGPGSTIRELLDAYGFSVEHMHQVRSGWHLRRAGRFYEPAFELRGVEGLVFSVDCEDQFDDIFEDFEPEELLSQRLYTIQVIKVFPDREDASFATDGEHEDDSDFSDSSRDS